MNKIISDVLKKLKEGNADFNSGIDAAFTTLKQSLNKNLPASPSNPSDTNSELHKPKIKGGSPDEQSKKDLIKKAKAIRDESQDVVDDNDELTNQEKSSQTSQDSSNKNNNQKQINKQDSNIPKQAENIAKEAENIAKDLNSNQNISKQDLEKTNQKLTGLQKRLDKIKNFWDDPKNQKNLQDQTELQKQYREYKKEIQKAHQNAYRRNSNYTPASISEIIQDLNKTLKRQTREYRDSDYSHYNPNAEYYDYVPPGRYNNTKDQIPNVVFYFDMSGSWSGNKEKIAMGHRIEEALKKLQAEKKINLASFYFAVKVHTDPVSAEREGGNSEEPLRHAINLVNTKQLDNVIIMTDSDPCPTTDLKVPGVAWLLFYDSVSQDIINHTITKNPKNKKIYMIQH